MAEKSEEHRRLSNGGLGATSTVWATAARLPTAHAVMPIQTARLRGGLHFVAIGMMSPHRRAHGQPPVGLMREPIENWCTSTRETVAKTAAIATMHTHGPDGGNHGAAQSLVAG